MEPEACGHEALVCVTHLLVTNDFPPKIGGIQSYLWELWRRLAPDSFAVLTTAYEGDREFDAVQPFRVERVRSRRLLPRRDLVQAIDRLAADVDARVVVLDPALPLGLVGPRLERPYGVVVHGAEVTVPGRLPGTRQLLAHVLRGASHVIAAGRYPAAEATRAAGRTLPLTVIPPGVDAARFRPLDATGRAEARERLGVGVEAPLVFGASRLVPRKGFDVLIEAAARLVDTYLGLHVAIAGAGRDRPRLERLVARRDAPVRFLDRVPDDDLPALYACADVFAMLCRNRWRGLEQEGFGIVFLEAASCGVPQVAGRSGGAEEAVIDGETGLVVRRPDQAGDVAAALARLLGDPELRQKLGEAARLRVETEFSYDGLARRLGVALSGASA
jgi:phosphatidylinositol alpha-1,6-mannosyltransferase